MHYQSTRGQAPSLDFKGVTLAGLARDGGLYVPADFPALSHQEIASFAGQPYHEVAFRVMRPFIGGTIADDTFAAMLRDTYGAAFHHAAVAPLVQLGESDFVLELFHGPTLAFKDFALQLLGRFFDVFTGSGSSGLTILGATSGDTGSAAIAGCRGREAVSIFMLHPKGRVSDVQRRQMTTILDANVHNIAIEGSFDDCQDLVKACFNDLHFRDAVALSAVNSINWARVLAQVVYYFTAGAALGAPARAVSFSVPTGNFGDIFAGYIARRMGLPIDKLVVATNDNDILARTIETGVYEARGVHKTLSPSMDIQVASNFERLLYDLKGREGRAVADCMAAFKSSRSLQLSDAEHEALRGGFAARRVDDAETLSVMRSVWQESGYLMDPHTATGLKAAREQLQGSAAPRVTLGTAHPAKFAPAVIEATGQTPKLPAHLADLMQREERYQTMPADEAALKAYIKDRLEQRQ